MHLSPAAYAVYVFGGVRKLAREIGRKPQTICAWKKSREEGGTGGLIPSTHHVLLLSLAKKQNKDLKPEDIIFGRTLTKKEMKGGSKNVDQSKV